MQIFQNEIDDGLSEKIKANASIAYAVEAEPYIGDKTVSKLITDKSIASFDDADLYYVQSILVSSSWNKNDDIFDKLEIWTAKNTPEDKPTNLEHDEHTIIGHITSNWPITDDGQILDDNIDPKNLPDKYHILTGSVIYRGYSNQMLKERAEKLIAEIENGSKYVSMECFFKGFDYGLIDKSNGSYKILSRNDETSYLTKFLRAYGGGGEHENYKIGRVLRNITFSGKGFVDKPANSDSIIFTKKNIASENVIKIKEKINDFSDLGVYNSQSSTLSETNTMSLENDIADIKSKLEALQGIGDSFANVTELKDKTLELENIIKANEQKISELSSALELALSEKEEAAKKMKSEDEMKDEEKKKMKAALDEANEVIAAYKNKEEEMMKKEKKIKRMAALTEIGLDSETIASTTDKFESLDDESFEAMTSLLAGMYMKKKMMAQKDEEEMKKDKNKGSENAISEEILEEVEVQEEVNLGIGGQVESEEDSTRAALVEFVRSRLSKSHK